MGEKAWRSRFFRTAEEKTRTLKNYGVHVLQREEKQRKKRMTSMWVVLGIVFALSLSFFFLSEVSFSGFTFFDQQITQTQDSAQLLVSESGFFLGNSTGTYQVDHVIIEPEIPYINNTLTCANGSTSTDVSSLLYIWYVNGSSLRLENRSTITRGNVSLRDRVECAIIPQNASSLVAYWPFDEGSGTESHEFVNNFSASSNQSNWSVGRNYYAIVPNATNNVTVGNTAGLNLTKNFTIELWLSAREGVDMELYNLNGFRILVEGGLFKVRFPLGANASALRVQSANSAPALGTWTHIVTTYDNTTLSLYVNGVLDNSTALSGRLGNYSGVLYFGRDPNTNATHFRGLIDEVAVYNASLTAAEVSDHYKKGIARLSKHNTLEIDTTQAQFANGTCINVNCTLESGNITLTNSSSTAYHSTGNFTSRILELPNGHDDPILRWSNYTPLGTNLSLQVRTGVQGDNDTITWSEGAGPDPTHAKDTSLIIGVDFAEGQGNVTITKGILTLQVNLSNNDFTPKGKHGYAARLYGGTSIDIPGDASALSLSSPKNYSIELWIHPISINTGVGIFYKLRYSLYTNESGNIIFNASYDSNTTSTPSISLLQLGNWTHIAITHDRDNTTRLYINGTLEKTQTNNGTMDTGTSGLNLGGGTSLTTFNGTLDSFVIYNRTLSPSEILSHARDRFTNSSGGEYTGELNRFIQYRVFFESNGTVRSPTLFDVSFQFFNYSAYIYNHNPTNLSLATPTNNSLTTTGNITLNWTTVSDLENDTLFYEFQLANDSNFTQILVSTLAINNVSQMDYSHDNHTLIVEHFELKETMIDHGFRGNWSNTQSYGRWGNGLELKYKPQFLRILATSFDPQRTTIEFWLRPNWNPNNDNETNYLLENSNGDLALNRSGTLLYLTMDASSPMILSYNISSWNANEWHHIAISWQRYKNLTLYLDGVRVNRTTAPNLTSADSSGFLYIGGNASSSRNILVNGTIDELRISTAARESTQDLNSSNYTITTAEYVDNTYYWRARSSQLYNKSFDGERSESSWEYRAIRLDTRLPNITATDDPIAIFGENTTSLNLTSNEQVYCEYKNHSGSYVPMTFTSALTHSQQINLSNAAGNYTYFINCNDTANKFANTTLSFYVFNLSAGTVAKNTTSYSFVANTSAVLNFISAGGLNVTRLNITTKNSIPAKISLIRHMGDRNPESTRTNLESEVVAFWTIIPDDILIANLSENMSVTLIYEEGLVGGLSSEIFKLYYFNYKTSSWVVQSETTPKGQLSVSFSTRTFGTYTLSNTPPPLTPKVKAPEPGKAKGPAPSQTPFIDFHDEIVEYIPYEFPFARLQPDEEQTLEMADSTIALFTAYFASNTYLEDVILLVVDASAAEGAYDAFTVYSETMDLSELSYLTLESTIEKSWMEENSYTLEDMVLVDEEGNIYTLTNVYEDDEYYYVQSDVNRFGTFTITTQTLAEQATTTTEETTITAEEEGIESATETISYAAEVEGFPSSLLSIFLYTAIFSLGFYYFSQIVFTFYFTISNRFSIREEELVEEDLTTLKNTLYINREKDLTEELLRQNWKEEHIKKIQSAIQKLPQGKLESYIYQRLSMQHSEQEIIKDLSRVGWEKKKTQKEIERFKDI